MQDYDPHRKQVEHVSFVKERGTNRTGGYVVAAFTFLIAVLVLLYIGLDGHGDGRADSVEPPSATAASGG